MVVGKFFVPALAAAGLFTTGANAAVIGIDNSSFETGPVLADGGTSAISGWRTSISRSDTGRWNPRSTNFPGLKTSPDDTYVAYAYGDETNDDPGTEAYATAGKIVQTLDITVDAFTRYTLTVDIGNPVSPTLGFGGFNVGLVAGDMDPATPGDRLLASLMSSELSAEERNIADGTFKTFSLTFETDANTAGIGQPLSIYLAALINSGAGYTAFDLVRLETTALEPPPVETPEPAALGLLGLGLAGLGLARRRSA